jgi:hypothetical protein
MSDKKKTDMEEVKDLWNKEQDKKEEAALNQAGDELFTGMRKSKDSTPMPKAKKVFVEPGAPSVGNFSRKLFDGGRKKRKSRRKRRKTKRKTKKRRRRKKRKSKKRRRNQRGCKR